MYYIKFNLKNEKAPRLKVFGVSARSLSEFVTTDKDLQRQIDRMPSDYYLIGNEKAADEELKKSAVLEMDFDDQIDDFFDFVLIEKDEMPEPQKKDAKSKLDKEMKIMTETSATLLASQPVSEGKKPASLDDFMIKKLIDKGSFGKVFHVVNTKDGREYAMKRINKDVLIEKGQIANTSTEKDILF